MLTMRSRVLVAVAVVVSIVFVAQIHAAESDSPFERTIRPFLAQHCVECHGAKDAQGDLRLDTLPGDFSDADHAVSWARIRERLRDGEMPPKEKPRPAPSNVGAVMDWIAAQTQPVARPPVVRRLNRVEYEYTLRDLFDMPGLEVKDLLPPDGEVAGFDTVAQALDVSYVQMARYLEASDAALSAAVSISLQPNRPFREKLIIYPQESSSWMIRVKGGAVLPVGDHGPDPVWDPETGFVRKDVDLPRHRKVRALATFFHSDPAGNLIFRRTLLAQPGMYKVKLSTFNFGWNKGEYLESQVTQPFALGTATRTFGYYDSPPNKPATIEINTWLDPADMLQFNAVGLPHGVALQQKGAAQWAGPAVAVEWLEIEGPNYAPWPPLARGRMFGKLPLIEYAAYQGKTTSRPPRAGKQVNGIFTPLSTAPNEDAALLLKDFMTLACRRPMPQSEIDRYLPLVRTKLAENATFEEAMRFAYQAVLCSPDFLFLRSEPQKKGKVDQYALAARLSYFLWKSLPDEELTRLAARNVLHRPEILTAQTERMLNDPKSRRFINDFTNQWLKLSDINATQPDKSLYPELSLEADVAPYLIDSMLAETRSYFETLVKEDLSVQHIVESDFAMLNEPLARHYGIEGVVGAAIRKVPLPPKCHRGGMLTQASVLKVSANGTTTSPVTRGAWVVTRILGKELKAPPPNIAAIDPDVRGATTVREQLAKHRSVELCATCHRTMDPPGFALESFDVVGGWRERYRMLTESRMSKQGPVVDPTGEISDGRAFKDIDEFKQLILSEPDQLARTLATKLLVYATGREPSGADELEIDAIVSDLRTKNYGIRALLHSVVQSRAFLAAGP